MAVSFRSLHTTLILPFALLVVAVAVAVFWPWYHGAQSAVDEVAERSLDDAVGRMLLATSQHLTSAAAVLNAVLPDSASRSDEVAELPFLSQQTVSQMEQRLWLASGLYPDRYRHVYYATESGRFVGVQRDAPGGAEARLRLRPNEPRRVYRAINPDRRGSLLREETYDPHIQPWYRGARERRKLAWSPVYQSASGELTATLAKPVFAPDGALRGVAATDVSLGTLAALVRTLKVSENAVAFIVEPNGALVASSSESATSSDPAKRAYAVASGHVFTREAFAAIATLSASGVPTSSGSATKHATFASSFGQAHLAVARYYDAAGLDWRLVVAVPHSDHMAPLNRYMTRSFVLGGIAVALALLLGFGLLRRVADDVRSVSRIAERLAYGKGAEATTTLRKDDIGSLTQSMAAIQGALLYDQLTGALKRDAFARQFAATVAQLQRFERVALVFIDLDGFKKVNDQYGHSVGDTVLAKSAERIRRRLRDADLLARFGGDEFVAMIHGNQAVQSIESLVGRLREHLRLGMLIEGNNIAVGASIGVAVYPDDGETLDELMRVADERMYGEKRRTAVVRTLREIK